MGGEGLRLFLWATPPALPEALKLVGVWGFNYTTFGFTWIKTTKAGEPKMGMGWHTRANAEMCLLAKRGKPGIRARDVRQVIMAPPREHSRKPDEQYAREAIRRSLPGAVRTPSARRVGRVGR